MYCLPFQFPAQWMTQIADASANDYKSCCYRDSKRKIWLRVGFVLVPSPSGTQSNTATGPRREPFSAQIVRRSLQKTQEWLPTRPNSQITHFAVCRHAHLV
jgi:hypothetical protein